MKELLKNAKDVIFVAAALTALGDHKSKTADAPNQAKVTEAIINSKKHLESATNRVIETMNKHNEANNRTIDELKRQLADLQERVAEYKGLLQNNKSKILDQIDTSVFKQIGPKNSDSEILAKYHEIMGTSSDQGLQDTLKKGIDLSGLWDLMKEAYDLYISYLATLSKVESGALAHLLVFIVIYILLLNIFTVVLGNWLLDYFKIDDRFPRLGK